MGIYEGPFDEAKACRKVSDEFKDICTCTCHDRRELKDGPVTISVTANFERSPECIYEQYPLSVFTADGQITVKEHSKETFTISKNQFGQMQFGIQGNDWYWRTKKNPFTSQWADNAGTEVIIKDASTCDFELQNSYHDDHTPDARKVFDVKLTSRKNGCHFTVTRKSNPGLSITKDCVGPCSPTQFGPGCECTSGGSTENCPTSN